MNVKEFSESAKGFTRSPLGIIALFIVLVYGFASIVVGFGKNISTYIEPLIYFMVCFPVIVFLGFLWLVSKHNKKLYGPSDFKDEVNFVSIVKNLELELDAISVKNLEDDNEEKEIKAFNQNKIKLDTNEINVLYALRDGDFTYRSLSGIRKDAGLRRVETKKILYELESKQLIGVRERDTGIRYFINGKGRLWLNEESK